MLSLPQKSDTNTDDQRANIRNSTLTSLIISDIQSRDTRSDEMQEVTVRLC